jgi:hypothetical protein
MYLKNDKGLERICIFNLTLLIIITFDLFNVF